MVAAVAPEVSGRYQVLYKAEAMPIPSVMGTTAAYTQVRKRIDRHGGFLSAIRREQFESVSPSSRSNGGLQKSFCASVTASATAGIWQFGQTIQVKSVQFTVVGRYGGKSGSGFSNQDDMIYVPLTTAQHYLFGKYGLCYRG